MVMCWGPSTQRQAQKLILGPSATAKVRLLSKVVTGLLYSTQNTEKTSLLSGADGQSLM
jgi:hypothetical protein